MKRIKANRSQQVRTQQRKVSSTMMKTATSNGMLRAAKMRKAPRRNRVKKKKLRYSKRITFCKTYGVTRKMGPWRLKTSK